MMERQFEDVLQKSVPLRFGIDRIRVFTLENEISEFQDKYALDIYGDCLLTSIGTGYAYWSVKGANCIVAAFKTLEGPEGHEKLLSFACFDIETRNLYANVNAWNGQEPMSCKSDSIRSAKLKLTDKMPFQCAHLTIVGRSCDAPAGLGQVVVNQAIDIAKSWGCSFSYLEAVRALPAFYSTLGFQKCTPAYHLCLFQSESEDPSLTTMALDLRNRIVPAVGLTKPSEFELIQREELRVKIQEQPFDQQKLYTSLHYDVCQATLEFVKGTIVFQSLESVIAKLSDDQVEKMNLRHPQFKLRLEKMRAKVLELDSLEKPVPKKKLFLKLKKAPEISGFDPLPVDELQQGLLHLFAQPVEQAHAQLEQLMVEEQPKQAAVAIVQEPEAPAEPEAREPEPVPIMEYQEGPQNAYHQALAPLEPFSSFNSSYVAPPVEPKKTGLVRREELNSLGAIFQELKVNQPHKIPIVPDFIQIDMEKWLPLRYKIRKANYFCAPSETGKRGGSRRGQQFASKKFDYVVARLQDLAAIGVRFEVVEQEVLSLKSTGSVFKLRKETSETSSYVAQHKQKKAKKDTTSAFQFLEDGQFDDHQMMPAGAGSTGDMQFAFQQLYAQFDTAQTETTEFV